MSSPASGDRAEDPRSRIEREELRRGHVPEGTPPAEPRAAATVVVARPGDAGFEVLLLERSRTSRFAAGAFVFPGGTLDDDDGADAWSELLPPTPEPAACVAALRELFEETGILHDPDERVGAAAAGAAREALLSGDRLFSEVAAELGLDFSGAAVAYFDRWITPRILARRYDTRFFLYVPSPAVREVRLTAEHESAAWERPDRALERCRGGELPMLFPTRVTLERLAGFGSLPRALAALGGRRVEPVLAKLDTRGGRIRPLMPGDEGYDDVY